jgi:hypothetical protein
MINVGGIYDKCGGHNTPGTTIGTVSTGYQYFPEPGMITYERIKRQVEFMSFFKGKIMIRLGHSKWNIWTEELL